MSVNVDVNDGTKKPSISQRAKANRDRRLPRRKNAQMNEEAKIVSVLILANLFGVFIVPAFMPYLYMSCYPFLWIQRIVIYSQRKFHFYLFDFCYFIHVLLMYFIFFDERNHSTIFSILWIVSVGWCNFGVIVWNNKLYFNLDLFFSYYLHFMPSLLMFCIHFQHKHDLEFSFTDGLFGAVIFFIAQTLIQYIIMFIWKKSENLHASYCYLTYKFVQWTNIKYFNQWFTLKYIQTHFTVTYICYQTASLVYLIGTGLISYILFQYWWLHAIMLVGLVALGLQRAVKLFQDQLDKKLHNFENQYKGE